jgi:hypothetical protein
LGYLISHNKIPTTFNIEPSKRQRSGKSTSAYPKGGEVSLPPLPEQPLKNAYPIRIPRRLVQANAVDARERSAMPDLCRPDQLMPSDAIWRTRPLSLLYSTFAQRAEAVDRVIADVAVELRQFFVGNAGIVLADRHQLFAVFTVRQTPKV